MLRNRYVIAGTALLLLLVLLYNYSFFQQRGADGPRSPVAPVPASEGGVDRPLATPRTDYRPEWRRDPFWYPAGSGPPAAARTGSPGPRAAAATLRLEGTMAKDGKGYALISGQVYGIGDRVAGHEITRIDGHSVTVRGARGTRVLRILSETTGKE